MLANGAIPLTNALLEDGSHRHHGHLISPAQTGCQVDLILRRPENCNLQRSDWANLLRCHGPFKLNEKCFLTTHTNTRLISVTASTHGWRETRPFRRHRQAERHHVCTGNSSHFSWRANVWFEKNLCIVVEVSKWQPLDLFSDPLSGSNSKQNVAEGMQEYLNSKHPEGDPPAGDAIPPPRSPWIMNPNQHGIKGSSRSAAHTFVGWAPHLSPSVHFRISVWDDLGHRQRSRSRGWEKGRAPRQESVIFKLL